MVGMTGGGVERSPCWPCCARDVRRCVPLSCTCSEEIAFYHGAKREKWIISHTFDRLIAHMRRSQQFRYLMGMVDTLVAKYFATVVGFWVISRPAFGSGSSSGS